MIVVRVEQHQPGLDTAPLDGDHRAQLDNPVG
jgi:hypothetical protein